MGTRNEGIDVKRGIFKNTLFNLAGSALPLIVAVFTIPLLIRGFGKEKFGILSLAWVLIGYFSLADFGLSRALTKFVAERTGQGKTNELPGLIWTALFLMTILGIVGAVLLALVSPVLVTSLLKIESTNTKEILNSFYLLSGGIPFTITAAGLRGILEARMRFDLSNYVRIALGVSNFVGPAFALLFSNNIMFPVVILVVSRIISLFAYLGICFGVLPEMKKRSIIYGSQIGPLLKYGGWVTVSNLISPIMVNIDRFFLAAMVPVSALAYYSTPWEVVARLLVIPSSLAGVMFPAFSQPKGAENAPSSDLYYRSRKYVLLSMFPLCLICAVFAKEVLHIWLGHEFALNSFRVMQVMAVAVLINGLAMIPFSLIQAAGRPDVTAKYHIIEFFIYIPTLWLFIHKLNILGAALAWLVRAALDLYLLLRYVKISSCDVAYSRSNARIILIEYQLGLAVIILIIPILINNLILKITMTVFVLIAFMIISWTTLLDKDEKKYISNKLGWTVN